MARVALGQFDLERVRVVAIDAGLVLLNVGKLDVVDLALVLISTPRLACVLGRSGRVVVDIDKAEIFTDSVWIHAFDGGVESVGGRASLVALHADRFGAETADLGAGGKDHGVERRGRLIVAGDAVDGGIRCMTGVHDKHFAAIGTDPILEARSDVAGGAAGGYLALIVPVTEGLSLSVSVTRREPHFLERSADRRGALGALFCLRAFRTFGALGVRALGAVRTRLCRWARRAVRAFGTLLLLRTGSGEQSQRQQGSDQERHTLKTHKILLF